MKYLVVTHVAKSGGPKFEQQALLCAEPLRIGIGSRIRGEPSKRQEQEVELLRGLGGEGGVAVATYGDMPGPSPNRAYRQLVLVKRGTPLIRDKGLGDLFTLVVATMSNCRSRSWISQSERTTRSVNFETTNQSGLPLRPSKGDGRSSDAGEGLDNSDRLPFMDNRDRRDIEEQLQAHRAELAETKAELRYLLRLARQWQQELIEKQSRHGATWN